uniref:Retrotransposon protein, putative, Ty1-copia subclass n=2 Tax=Oryza sativa subsp. japonica TaxID=39947 RepID=Q53ML4_ORYSJ|nr:retrotransposon protein, putative, Ty1-copia sub-class [Oryza sativa Japonica Group]ABA92692.1 retrotransposon protein, putative, Ty1-copia subclass [Oryza sativa Japonica Group]
MATPARFSTKPHIFDGTDFPDWCSMMQSYIMAENYDIWRKVSHPYVIPEAINIDALKTEFENNCKARNILLSGISRADYDRVVHLETAHEIWNSLKNFHQGTNNIKEHRRDLFKNEYIKFEMKPGKALDDYLSRFNKILSDLRSADSSYDANYPQSEISRHFLNGLDMSIWEMKVTSIQEFVNMSTLTLDSLYTKLKTHEMNILSRKVDSKSSALVSSSSSLDVDASSSKSFFLAVFNATSDDQLEQIEEDDLALVANRIARAMNNARNRKRGGPNRCFECGSIDHLRSHCPKLGRGKREDKDGEKTNNNKPNNNKSKGSNPGGKMENLRKAFQQVCAAFEPLSNVDGESGDDDKGKNVSDVCFMARGESDTEYEDNEESAFEEAINILSAKNKKCGKMYKKQEFIIESLKSEICRLKSLIPNDDDCENCEVLMNEISKIRDVNAAHDLKNRSSLACSFALHTRTLDELFLTKKLLQKYQIAFHASLMFNMISAKKLKQPHDILDCSTCNLNKMKLKDALGRVEYMEDVVKNNEVLSCPKCRKGKGVMVDCENCANLEKEISYLKNSLLRFSDGKKNLNMILDQSKVLVLEVALVARKENVWIVDSGCSRHMTGDKNWFSSLKKASKTESIIFGDATTSAVLATALVEDLKYNLLSVSQIVDEEFEVHFKKTGSKVFDSRGDSVLNISRYGRVFKADFENSVSPVITCLVAKFDKDVMFWHRRLGHVGFDHLTRLSGLDLVRGLSKLKKDHDLMHRDSYYIWTLLVQLECNLLEESVFLRSKLGKTSYELRFGHQPNVSHLRVFGCKCFVLKSGNLDKFEARSTDGLFLGYLAHTHGYRVLILGTNKIVETCEVSFDEASPGSGEDGRIIEDESDYDDDDEVGSAGKTGRQAGQTAGTPPVRPAPEERSDRLGSSGLGTVDADRDGPPEITTSTSNDTERESTSEVAAPLHIQRRHPPEQIIGNIGERTTRSKVTTHDVCANSVFVAYFEPKDVSHALTDESWINAMHEELENFERNKVWTLVEPPSRRNIIGTKWGFKNKQNEDGLIVRNKARLVAQGFTQVEGLDFDETFAPVARIEAIRLLFAFAASKGFKLYQMGVKSAFLNGFIQEEVYVKQPPGFENPDFPNHVFKLSKALYGLKQAPRAWYDRLKNFLLAKGFTMGKVDRTLFVLKHGDNQLFVQIYVDDIIFGCSTLALVVDFAETMRREFDMSMMGELSYFLGLQIKQTPQGTFEHQTNYTKDLLRRFKMENCKPISTPISSTAVLDPDEDGEAIDQKEYRTMIGSLLYLTASRPDIQFAVCLCARFQASPRASHRQAIKRIMSYLNHTLEFGIWYSTSSSICLSGYSDADFGGCRIGRKSTSGTCHFLGTSLIASSSRKQSSVAQSTAESESVAAASCCSQILWLLSTLKDYGLTFEKVTLFCDNTSAINIAKNPIQHSRTKHIDIRFHFLRDHVEKGDVELLFLDTKLQIADIFTKPLDSNRFAFLRGELGVIHPFGMV